jgi:hypothetical protein
VVLVGLVGGGYYFYSQYEIEGLKDISLRARNEASRKNSPFGPFVNSVASGSGTDDEAFPQPERTWIRIASFNFGPVDRKKMAKRNVVGSLAKLIAQFDILAVQDIRSPDQGLLLRLIEELNAGGRHFDFAGCLHPNRQAVTHNAFLYDKQTVEIDPSTVCQVNDESGRFRHTPLVASFRARGPDAARAFTFTLINVHVEMDRASTEINLLDDVFRAVRDDGRGEDDVILLGHLAADERQLGELETIPNLSVTVSRVPTNTRGTRIDCNLLFDRVATIEYTGRSDVLDFMRHLELSMPEALEVSENLPVWAEFSVFEGGQPGQVALGYNLSTR